MQKTSITFTSRAILIGIITGLTRIIFFATARKNIKNCCKSIERKEKTLKNVTKPIKTIALQNGATITSSFIQKARFMRMSIIMRMNGVARNSMHSALVGMRI